jgi:predicted MFS family arabinose efflux permease
MHTSDVTRTIELPWRMTACSVAVCVSGGLMPSLQPLLLGALADSGRISLPQIGEAATLEGLAMAITTGFAGVLLPARSMRTLVVAAVIVAAAVNALTSQLSGEAVLAMRAINGVCSGLMLWQMLQVVARIHAPGRIVAVVAVTQAIALSLLSLGMSYVLLPRYGGSGAYFCLVAMNLAMIAAAAAIPDALPELPIGARTRYRLPDLRGIAGLVSNLLQFAAIMSFWVYLPAVAQSAGQPGRVIATAITTALSAQIVAGFAAVVFAPRLPPTAVLTVCSVASIAAIGITVGAGSPAAFIAAVAVFGFCWMFSFPFQAPFLILIDHSRAAVMLVLSVQLFGIAAGSILASRVGIANTPWLSAVLYGLSIVALITARFGLRAKHMQELRGGAEPSGG